ncbi:kinesin light chain-related protein 1 [Tanacetum coccineum]
MRVRYRSFGWVNSKDMIKFTEDVHGKPCTKAQDEVTFTSGKMTELIRNVAHQVALPTKKLIERLTENFGSKHFGVGYVYNNLGAAYLELDMPQSAAQVFAMAKDIMDTTLRPHHVDSIEACKLCIEVNYASKVATISKEICIGMMLFVFVYAAEFELDAPMIQPQLVESTQGTHRTHSTPRSPNPKKMGESSVMKIPIRFNLKKKETTRSKKAITNVQLVKKHLLDKDVDIMVDEDETESDDDDVDAKFVDNLFQSQEDPDTRIHLRCKYEKSYDPTLILIDTCRTDTLRKRNHDNQLLSLISQA